MAISFVLRLVATVVVVVKTEPDCFSFLMSRHRSSTNFQDGQCVEQDGDRRTDQHDNVVEFQALDYGEFDSLQFSPTWYEVTAGQPVPSDCLAVDSRSLSEQGVKVLQTLLGPSCKASTTPTCWESTVEASWQHLRC